jgi:hypothetical protein
MNLFLKRVVRTEFDIYFVLLLLLLFVRMTNLLNNLHQSRFKLKDLKVK